MRYVGPLTGADRAEHYVALARLERRQQRVAAAMGSAGQLIKTQYLTGAHNPLGVRTGPHDVVASGQGATVQ
jgi:hypothetical protein